MADWFVECSVGAYPPFLQRNIKKHPEFHTKKIPEEECCSIEVQDLDGDFDSYQMQGYVKTSHAVVPVEVRMRDPIVLFSCFDVLFVHVFASKDAEVRLFSTEIACRQSWGAGVFRAREVRLPGGAEPRGDSLSIRCRTRNLRDAGVYHYNIEPPARQERLLFTVRLEGAEHCAVRYTCILCFLRFECIEPLADHIGISHCRYSCGLRDGVLWVHARGKGAVCGPEGGKRVKRSPDEAPRAGGRAVSFMRRSAAPVLGRQRSGAAGLRNHKMLIEREYDTQDYSWMLARHANADMSVSDGARGRPVAEEWNRLRIANVGAKDCLRAILRKFDLSAEAVRLAEILYKKGVLNSGEILDALDGYKARDGPPRQAVE